MIGRVVGEHIQIENQYASNLPCIEADTGMIEQVVMNLVVNSRDAMPNGGKLSISAETIFLAQNDARKNLDAQVGPYIVIKVSDTGTGIPPEILDRIFEPFFTTKEIGKGTGLGLSTVIGIIKSHSGFVKVYSEVGRGTQFRVYLPVAEVDQTPPVEDLEMPQGHGELILVVDDEAAIRDIIKASLETYNYKALTASDGIEAITLYVEHRDEISVVLTDMMMPSMDGPTTIRTLQKIEPQVKIVAVSGLVSNDKLTQVAKFGVKNFLSKPYTTKELLTTLSEVINTN
jgi:CheY-like chemotaxis protein